MHGQIQNKNILKSISNSLIKEPIKWQSCLKGTFEERELYGPPGMIF